MRFLPAVCLSPGPLIQKRKSLLCAILFCSTEPPRIRILPPVLLPKTGPARAAGVDFERLERAAVSLASIAAAAQEAHG